MKQLWNLIITLSSSLYLLKIIKNDLSRIILTVEINSKYVNENDDFKKKLWNIVLTSINKIL